MNNKKHYMMNFFIGTVLVLITMITVGVASLWAINIQEHLWPIHTAI